MHKHHTASAGDCSDTSLFCMFKKLCFSMHRGGSDGDIKRPAPGSLFLLHPQVILIFCTSANMHTVRCEGSQTPLSHCNMTSLVQPLSVFTQCLDDIAADLCSRQKVSHSWQLRKNKAQFSSSNRPSVCEMSFYSSDVSQTSVTTATKYLKK